MPDKQDDIATIAQAMPVLDDMARSEHPRDTTLAKVLLALIHLQPMNFGTAGPDEIADVPTGNGIITVAVTNGYEGQD